MSLFTPKYITFDCYGTLIYFEMANAAAQRFSDRVPAERMKQFTDVFAAYRFDEVLGAWKPYLDVVDNAIRRTCERCGVEYRDGDGKYIYDLVPTWGPHADTAAGLRKVAREFPLVALTNAMDAQIPHNIERIGVPFHAVYTAQQAQAYKPHMRAFEFMLDQLGCGPEDILHVSSSLRYDLMTAHDMGIRHKVFVARGHEPSTPYYGYTEIRDIGGLAAVVGL
ncbi:haloacid dehalogenase, type II [Bordetella genomosp. 9]|uniref:Haloacid dehalogenase, type II n=1 Tax=Bordetella genomosp. 9 TaxID=1416803 RepID=A0A261RE80_9BORD|nr:haloacid dehalogenase type II [Bordetella genomosp. 9]OZI23275.1 haloacid dehalogenase, type II [Bordetella genomosp. 9]